MTDRALRVVNGPATVEDRLVGPEADRGRLLRVLCRDRRMHVRRPVVDVRHFLFRVVPRRRRWYECCHETQEQRAADAGPCADIPTRHVRLLSRERLSSLVCFGHRCPADLRCVREREARTRSEVRRGAETAAAKCRAPREAWRWRRASPWAARRRGEPPAGRAGLESGLL